MTNREWLEGMNDADLANVLQDSWCELVCGSYGKCEFEYKCEERILKWLQGEFKAGKRAKNDNVDAFEAVEAKKRKIIFLDVDGVLNSSKWANEMIARENFDPFQIDMLNPKAIARLKQIVDATGAEIVVSSSWRETEEAMRALKDQLAAAGLCISGTTPELRGITEELRGCEIARWITERSGSIEGIVILDDGDNMGELKPYLVQTTFADGLQDCHVKRAIEMLNGKNDNVDAFDYSKATVNFEGGKTEKEASEGLGAKVPNNDLISRGALFKSWDTLDETQDPNLLIDAMIKATQDAPAVEMDGDPVIHSVWLKHEGAQKTSWHECANCNTIGSPRWKRCPVCEAKMEVQN